MSGKIWSVGTLKTNLRQHLNGRWSASKGNYAGFHDHKYYLPDSADFDPILSSITMPPYRPELFDCDDLSYAFKAAISLHQAQSSSLPAPLAVGIIWGFFRWVGNGQTFHACNLVCLADQGPQLLEPQHKAFHPVSEAKDLKLLLI